MNKRLLSIGVFLALGGSVYSQVGVGTEMPNGSAQLEVVANNRGVLIPRIQLNGIDDQSTILNGNINSLLVFNTATNSTLSPGYYYWHEDSWKRIVDSDDIAGLDLASNTVIYNGDSFTYVDENGESHVININEIIKANETTTTLVNNEDGTYTYTNENGDAVIIDVPADVINNFDKIVQDPDVVNQITNVFENTEIGGNVKYDG
ncbi:hypothetical protein JM658_15680, partial [Joostella atrarenae]|nr:hypothetical protein [Joostella atrarenae]